MNSHQKQIIVIQSFKLLGCITIQMQFPLKLSRHVCILVLLLFGEKNTSTKSFSCQLLYCKDLFPLAKCSPWLLINPFLGHRAASLNLCRRFGPAPSFLSVWMLLSVCVGACCTGFSFQKVKCFSICLLVSVWMFSRSLSGIQWRLPCCVPESPAVCFSEKPAEECDAWKEK